MVKPRIVLLIFVSGKVVLTGVLFYFQLILSSFNCEYFVFTLCLRNLLQSLTQAIDEHTNDNYNFIKSTEFICMIHFCMGCLSIKEILLVPE